MLNLLRSWLFGFILYNTPPGPGAGDPPAGGGDKGTPPAGGGAPGAGDPPPPGAPGGGAPAGGAAGKPPVEKSVLTQHKESLEPPKPIAERIPEKYRVYDGEGDKKVLNVEKSLEKVEEGRASLEQQMSKAGGLPVEKIDDYKIELPKDSKITPEMLDGELTKAFREKALSVGMTAKQFNVAVNAHLESVDMFLNAIADHSSQACEKELKATPGWEGPNYKANLDAAYKTFAAFAGKDEAAEIDRIGSNPLMLRILANIGKHIGEAQLNVGPGIGSSLLGDDKVQEYLRPGSPYYDKTHPDHKKAVEVMTRHFEAAHGRRPAMVGVINSPAAPAAGKS